TTLFRSASAARGPAAQGPRAWSSNRRPDAPVPRVQRLIDGIRDQAEGDERQRPLAAGASELAHRSANALSLTGIVPERGAYQQEAEHDDDDRASRDTEPADAAQQPPGAALERAEI